MEEWKDIKGYEGLYQVSSLGRVFSVRSNKCLQPFSGGGNYLKVNLHVNGQVKHCRIHRLVAEAFLPNPDLLPQVNHKNEDTKDNRVSNLEWCTAEYNTNYGTRNKRISVPVDQYTTDGEFIKAWDGATAAAKELNICISNITMTCRGERKTAGGYKWKYHKNF